MKELMIGNAAVARGLYEAGCRYVSSYPGTPSTEITEFAAGYDEVYAEWASNEKVALESAVGASLAGARSFTAMKHVGLNVAADPLFTAAYVGVNAGLVVLSLIHISSSAGSPHSARAIITRWQRPPESSWGYCFRRRSGASTPASASSSTARARAAARERRARRRSVSHSWLPTVNTGSRCAAGS